MIFCTAVLGMAMEGLAEDENAHLYHQLLLIVLVEVLVVVVVVVVVVARPVVDGLVVEALVVVEVLLVVVTGLHVVVASCGSPGGQASAPQVSRLLALTSSVPSASCIQHESHSP